MRKDIGTKYKSYFCFLTAVVIATVIFSMIRCEAVMGYDEIVVVIDPGHGGESDGTEGESNSGATYHGLVEKDITLITANALRDELSEYGNVSVYLTREEDVAMPLDERVEYAKSVNADVLVSIHYNASGEHNFFGSEIFTSAFGQCYATGYGLATCIMDEWVENGNIEKDIKTRIGNSGADYYGIIRHGTEKEIPTIILEHAYLDNDKDYQRIKTREAWEEFGREDARGIAKYFGLEKNVVKESVGSTIDIKIPDEPVKPDASGPDKVDLRIDSYNSNKGDIEFTINAFDENSKLMYYGFVTEEADEDTVFKELELWNGSHGKLTGTYHIQPGYEGPLTATVYNVYQYNTNSNVVMLTPDETAPDDEEDNAVKNEDEESEDSIETEEIMEESDSDGIIVEADKEVFEIGGDDKNTIDESMAKAIEEGTESTVEKSYYKLLIVGLIIGVVLAVTVVLIITSAISKKKRRRNRQVRERKSYSWIDEDD